MKTGTNTIILFLKKLNNLKGLEVKEHLDNAFKSKRDVTINGIKNPIDTYLKEVYNSKFSDFLSILNGKPNEKIIKLDIYKEYASEFYKIKEIKDLQRKRDFNELSEEEQKKVLTARLCSYISEEEKTTSLYDVEGVDNPENVNYYIKNNFLGKKTEIAESLQGVVFYQKLSSLIDFRQTEFNKTINLNPKEEFESKYEKVKLKNNYEVEKGTSITEEQTRKGGIPVIAGGKQPAYYHNSSNREGYTITISGSGANAGYVSFFDKPIFASDCSTIKSTNERIASTKV